MPDLVIKENELPRLDSLIGEIPTKFGLPLVNFFNQLALARQQEADSTKTKNEAEDPSA